MSIENSFGDFFEQATENRPYEYQVRLATGEQLPELIEVPTGLGKTAAIVLAWLWRRRFADDAIRQQTSRRLVYCLPMRTLVEQTRDCAVQWLDRLQSFAGTVEYFDEARNRIKSYTLNLDQRASGVAVYVLMGGEAPGGDWCAHPERDAIIIGTQDMLLSRALNRGYAARRARWPVEFGLLHSDCVWVVDEVQLMGCGLATTAQFDAFAKRLWKPSMPTRFLWMSATMGDSFLQTRDRCDWQLTDATRLGLTQEDLDEPAIQTRLYASKTLRVINDRPKIATILDAHPCGRISLLMLNTVPVAKSVYADVCAELAKPAGTNKPKEPRPKVCLLHSRFRPMDRKRQMERLLAFLESMDESGAVPDSAGLIVVSTQVLEAGVDLSSARLWSEVAPWPSVIQRLGRLNREGSQPDASASFWRPKADETNKGDESPNAKRVGPYEKKSLDVAEKLLEAVIAQQAEGRNYRDALDAVLATDESRATLIVEPEVVIRPDDFSELFATEPDLAGGFTNVSQFVRDQDRNVDVHVFWRDFNPAKVRQPNEPAPDRDELCSVPFFEFRQFVGKLRVAWEWNFETGQWESRRAYDIQAGMTLLLPKSAGGYRNDVGWTGDAKDDDFDVLTGSGDEDSLDADFLSGAHDWVSLPDHLADVEAEMREIVHAVELQDTPFGRALLTAARWHDWGKAIEPWQQEVRSYTHRLLANLKQIIDDPDASDLRQIAACWLEHLHQPDEAALWAKFPNIRAAWADKSMPKSQRDELKRRLNTVFRPRLRHEAASALAAWQSWLAKSDGLTALAVYLIACHHGKVRTVLRSTLSAGGDVFGLTDGMTLQPVPGFFPNATLLRTDAKYVGASGEWDEAGTSFTLTSPSWLQMIDELLGPNRSGDPPTSEVVPESEPRDLGPLKLSYFEALLRAADVRASHTPGKGGKS